MTKYINVRKILAVLLTLSMLSLVACGGSQGEPVATPHVEQEQVPEMPTPTPAPTPEPTSEPTPEPTQEPEPEYHVYEIGETATIGNWEVTLDSFEFTNRVEAGRFYYSPLDDNTFLYAMFTVTNLGTMPNTFLSRVRGTGGDFSAQVRYGEVFGADAFVFGTTNLTSYRDDLERTTTNPLSSTTASITFSIANRAVESDEPMVIFFVQWGEPGLVIFNVR